MACFGRMSASVDNLNGLIKLISMSILMFYIKDSNYSSSTLFAFYVFTSVIANFF